MLKPESARGGLRAVLSRGWISCLGGYEGCFKRTDTQAWRIYKLYLPAYCIFDDYFSMWKKTPNRTSWLQSTHSNSRWLFFSKNDILLFPVFIFIKPSRLKQIPVGVLFRTVEEKTARKLILHHLKPTRSGECSNLSWGYLLIVNSANSPYMVTF